MALWQGKAKKGNIRLEFLPPQPSSFRSVDQAIRHSNLCLGDYLYLDQGTGLMRTDSEITSLIHNNFTHKGIPALSAHDSYLVDRQHVGELRQVMLAASEEVNRKPLRTSYNFPEPQEFEDVGEAALQKHVHYLS